MADRFGSLVAYFVGLAIILFAVWVLFTQTGLDDFIPIGVVVAVILLVVGLGVMAAADRFDLFPSRTVVVDRGYYGGTYAAPPPAYASPQDRTVREEREVRYEDRYP